MEILNKKQKFIFIIIIVFILLFISYYIVNKINSTKYIELETEESSNLEESKDQEENQEDNISEDSSLINTENVDNAEIIVHVTGAVNKQGIVKLNKGSRIIDAIEAAGGANSNADLSKINLAYIVEDGLKIYVPSKNDKDTIYIVETGAGQNSKNEEVQDNDKNNNNNSINTKININTATQTELETLTGIGPSTALKIINYRNENGKFKKIEDIKNVPGIGDAKYKNIKNSISIK